MQKNISESDINVTCSGSTFVGVFIDNDEIVCSNVGDSRAILARQSINIFIQLIEKVGNLSIFLRIINLLFNLKRKESSKMEEEFMLLEIKMECLLGLFGSGFLTKVSQNI